MFSSVQFSSVAQLCPTLWDPMNCSTPGLPVHHQLSESTQTHIHWVGDAIQPSHALSSPSPPAFNLFQHQGLFKWVSSSHQVAKYWSFSFRISPTNEYPALISSRMVWLDLLAVQGTLKSHMDYNPPGSSVHGILQARILEWFVMPSPRGSAQPRDQTQVSLTVGGFFTIWATREALLFFFCSSCNSKCPHASTTLGPGFT